MTAAEWASLIPAIVALLGVLTNYLRSRQTNKVVAAHQEQFDVHVNGTHADDKPLGPVPPPLA